jgi:DNA-binding MarR family transcriptional regulator
MKSSETCCLAPSWIDLRQPGDSELALLMEVEQRGPISLIPLADAMVMDRATLGHNIRPLEADGYLISLTKSGRKILAEAKPLWQRAQAIFESEIGLEEAAGLRPSMVTISAPSCMAPRVRQERMRWLLTSIVQAPQAP